MDVSRDLVFWQTLLTADLSPLQRQKFFEDLIPGVDATSALRSWSGLSSAQATRVRNVRLGKLEQLTSQGVKLLAGDELPANLSHSPGAPAALFAEGDVTVLDRPCVSIVGTRNASSYGKATAHRFAEALARLGVTVVSGGALGIDSAAHRGALDGGGATVAVLGTGIDIRYPSANTNLFAEMIKTGCLLSPYAIGTPSLPQNFLRRNPVVAALATVLLVIEAPIRSGSLSTAASALELGKDVFVVPGPVTLESFRGSHQLIREGATLIDHPDQIGEVLGLEDLAPARESQALDPLEEKILAHLGAEPRTGDHLVSVTGEDAPSVMAALTMMELDGLILRDRSGYIRSGL